MLIDRFLPTYETSEYHQVTVEAEQARVYRAVRELDLSHSILIRLLLAIRGLPRHRPLGLNDLVRVGFVFLGEEPGREIVFGVTGRFWRVRGGLRRVGPNEFFSFSEPGYAKAVWNFSVEALDGGLSQVSTETRVATTDPESGIAFRRYWLVVGPFSGLIRRRALGLIKKSAEQTS